MQEPYVENIEITEKLRVNIDGKVYTLEVKYFDELFKHLRITLSELSELKKLPSHLRDHLFAKFIFKGKIKEVVGEPQVAFNL